MLWTRAIMGETGCLPDRGFAQLSLFCYQSWAAKGCPYEASSSSL